LPSTFTGVIAVITPQLLQTVFGVRGGAGVASAAEE
jgi:hypothetical protein